MLDLGDRHPWYLPALYPPISLAAGCTIGFGFHWLRTHDRAWTVPALVCAVLVFVLVTKDGNQLGRGQTMVKRYRAGQTSSDYLKFEQARREAGRVVHRLAEPGDIVQTCFGWIAYEAHQQQIDELCPLNTRQPVGPADWTVIMAWPVVPGLNDVPVSGTITSTYSYGDVEDARFDIVRVTPE